MTRFQSHRRPFAYRSFIISIAIFIVIFFSIYFGISHFSENTRARQLENLERALTRSIIYCYTLEGEYPESLDYIKEHYGLIYNEDLFFIDYRMLGSNIMPDVTIIERSVRP